MASTRRRSEPNAITRRSVGGGGVGKVEKRARNRKEGRPLLRRRVNLRQTSNHRGVDDGVQRLVNPFRPDRIIGAPVRVERLVPAPPEKPLDQLARAIGIEQGAAEKDTKRVNRVVGEQRARHAPTRLQEQEEGGVDLSSQAASSKLLARAEFVELHEELDTHHNS